MSILFLPFFAALFAAGHCQSPACQTPDLNVAICQFMLENNLCSTTVAQENCYITCNPLDCDTTPCATLPEIAENGFRLPVGGGHRAGNTVTYHCNTGYLLVGVTSNECQLNHTWTSSAAPVCIELCPALPTVAGFVGTLLSTNPTVNSMAEYKCSAPGAKVSVGDPMSQCTRNGTGSLVWSVDPTLACSTVGSCSAPPMILHNGINPESRAYFDGEKATYQCQEGYVFVGEYTNMCMNGSWVNLEPFCVPACGDNVAPATCQLYKDRGQCSSLTQVQVDCRKTCNLCGNCTTAPPTDNLSMVMDSGPFVGGQIVPYSCAYGLVNGANENVCLGSNNWAFPAPTCHKCGHSIF